MKMLLKRRHATMILFVVIALASLGCTPSQSARPNGGIRPLRVSVSPDDPCKIFCAMMVVIRDQKVRFDVAGNAVARDIAFSDADNPIASATEKITSLVATGSSREFGTVTTTLDTSREAQPAIITANQKGRDFPATGNINFNVNVRLGSQPGVVYRNREEIRIEDRNLTAFRPHIKANYHLLKPVEFVDVNKPDVSAFTMNELNVEIN